MAITKLIFSRILSLSDDVFKSFVHRLKQEHNAYLCAVSAAVSDIVTALFRTELADSIICALEQVELAKIVEFQRGCMDLIRLIS